MKLWKTSIRIWIAFVSILSFIGGWILFAHSTKPAAASASSNANNPPAVNAPLPTLVPLAPMGSNPGPVQPLQNILPQQPSQSFAPFFRSFGS